MSVTWLIALAGSAVACGRIYPQLFRAMRLRVADGVSLASGLVGLIGAAGWTLYGVLSAQAPLAVSSALTLSAYVVTYLYLRRMQRHSDLGWVLAWGAGLMVATAIGASVLGGVLALAPLATGVLQIVAVSRPGATVGVSAAAWVVASIEGALWVTYGLLVGDVPAGLAGGFHLGCAVWILTSLHVKRSAEESVVVTASR